MQKDIRSKKNIECKNNCRNKKAQVWISAVLYILITTIILVIVIQFGTPLLENLKDKSIFSRTKDNFVVIDKNIKEVAQEGYGSQRIIPLEVQKGQVNINQNGIKWEMKTNADIVEPGSSVNLGDLTIASNSDVSATQYSDSYILENSQIAVNISRSGNDSAWTNTTIDVTKIINYLEKKTANGKIRQVSAFNFNVANNGVGIPGGNGYTKLLQHGDSLTSATIIVHINSTVEYDLAFTLDSRADFLKVNVVNRKD